MASKGKGFPPKTPAGKAAEGLGKAASAVKEAAAAMANTVGNATKAASQSQHGAPTKDGKQGAPPPGAPTATTSPKAEPGFVHCTITGNVQQPDSKMAAHISNGFKMLQEEAKDNIPRLATHKKPFVCLLRPTGKDNIRAVHSLTEHTVDNVLDNDLDPFGAMEWDDKMLAGFIGKKVDHHDPPHFVKIQASAFYGSVDNIKLCSPMDLKDDKTQAAWDNNNPIVSVTKAALAPPAWTKEILEMKKIAPAALHACVVAQTEKWSTTQQPAAQLMLNWILAAGTKESAQKRQGVINMEVKVDTYDDED